MEYEKGKIIENCLYEIRNMLGSSYGDKPETDLEKIYRKLENIKSDLNRVLGNDNY